MRGVGCMTGVCVFVGTSQVKVGLNYLECLPCFVFDVAERDAVGVYVCACVVRT